MFTFISGDKKGLLRYMLAMGVLFTKTYGAGFMTASEF